MFGRKKRNPIWVVSIKRSILPSLFLLFTIFLVVFSSSNLAAAKSGLALWANSVVPSLLPFFIATELLGYTNIVTLLGKALNKIMRPIFNVPGEGAFAFIMGIISGYPVGAKIVTDFRRQGICTKAEGERLLAFTNNSGPLFIIGTVGISLFADSKTGLLLLCTHILACISVGIIFRFWKRNHPDTDEDLRYQKEVKSISFGNLGEVIATSITNSINTIMMIGGFVILFSVIISILNHSKCLDLFAFFFRPFLDLLGISPNFASPICSGLIELTNGVKLVSSVAVKDISTNIILCAFLLGFGGISVLLQVFSITSKSDISIKPYFLGKLLQGTLASIYTYFALTYIPFLNLDLEPVFNQYTSSNTINLTGFYWLFLLLTLLLIFFFTCQKKHQKKVFPAPGKTN